MNAATDPLRAIAAALRRGPALVTLRGLVPPARPVLAAALRRTLGAPVLAVTAGSREAERFRDEAAFWLPPDDGPLLFPGLEVLPFEPLSAEPAIAAERIATLARLAGGHKALVAAPLDAVLARLVPRGKFLLARSEIVRGESLDWERIQRSCLQWGYRPSERVSEPGELSRRGGIVDLFPPGSPTPVRLDLVGDEVDAIFSFDPETQRNVAPLERVVLLPARELFLDGGALARLKPHLPASDGGERGKEGWLLQQAAALPALEHYGALLLKSRQTLLDYFRTPPVVLLDEWPDLEARAARFEGEIARGASRASLPELADAEAAFVPFDRWRRRLDEFAVLQFDLFGLAPRAEREMRVETVTGRAFLLASSGGRSQEGLIGGAVRALAGAQRGTAPLIVARSEEDAGRIRSLCAEQELGTVRMEPGLVPARPASPRPGAPGVTWGPITEGFSWPAAGLLVLSEDDIFGAATRPREVAPSVRGSLLPDFALLREGDLLVHTDYGIGRFGGLVHLAAKDAAEEFVLILYEDDAKLYVPVGSLDRVQRYVAAEGSRPAVDRLGGRGWTARKRRAKRAILEMARELVRLAALRQTAPGHAFSPDGPWQAEFELAFPYPPTRDQLRAAEDVKSDMERPHPMDRLVCGDVGYGKTEVAMRAAFKAATDGRQVALLAPTTVLVQQHFTTFRERFAPWPIRVEMLSRFVPPREQRRVVAAVAAGEVDIVIGTHRLLARDVAFCDLGLVIVDEEQRFGVRHKEGLKALRATVDVLTLSATPIPRTLHLSLAGMRDLSLIATPPENRLAIRTTIARFSARLVEEAVRRETARGGQVFFVHNRVVGIERLGAWLRRLLPDVRVGIAHGQMDERKLAAVMAGFRAGEYDLLLSTSIVESGLDIPNANTMIVHRADRFGLADLYQLRGRIGRGSHRAYAYLLVPGERALTSTARRRIEALREYAHLGAGFQIALHDLEIRGAGNIVGYAQSGHIEALGFDLYTRLLQETIRELQGEPVPDEQPALVSLGLPAALPRDYVEATAQRLTFYRRIAAVRDTTGLEEVASELRERFGPLPDPARNLLWAAELRIAGEALGIKRVIWGAENLELAAGAGVRIPPERLADLVAASEGRVRLRPDNRLAWRWGSGEEPGRMNEARELLMRLGPPC